MREERRENALRLKLCDRGIGVNRGGRSLTASAGCRAGIDGRLTIWDVGSGTQLTSERERL
jgi:hypothetical protein